MIQVTEATFARRVLRAAAPEPLPRPLRQLRPAALASAGTFVGQDEQDQPPARRASRGREGR